MFLHIARKLSGSSDVLMSIIAQRNIPAFRLNLDMFNKYQFMWRGDEFEIEDCAGHVCRSSEVDAIAFYKGLFSIDEILDFDSEYTETKWLKSWMNNLYHCFVRYGIERNQIRLWHPSDFTCSKPWQMSVAKEFFEVPEFTIHWGFSLQSKEVVAKPLTQRPLQDNGEMLYAKIVDRAQLDPRYPWFTQEIADGDRDATILYVNGHVHCYQFATPRGELTDWRTTQGTEVNKWEPWDAGKDFENRIDAYMRKMNLKFGRLDFIIGGKEPQFLEVNPVGQFGWLDDEKLTLHNEVVDAILDESSTIII
ncbi:MAG: hypothetical protein IJG38_06545 [Thermoguttaceae bacterium]|nr:hypothetical protein [Thermoguttaceae bacterium]